MRTVGDQLAAVLSVAKPVRPLDVVLADAVGCILAEDLVVPHDVPARPVAGLDGYALQRADLAAATSEHPVRLPVVRDVWAAESEPFRLVEGQAVRMSTGAPIPIGADALVPLEYSDRGDVQVRIGYQPEPGEHILEVGAHARQGAVAISEGTRLGGRQLALAASLGYARLRVYPKPRVVIMTIGDELTAPLRSRPSDIHDASHQTFDANGVALRTAVLDAGAVPIQVGPVSDDHGVLREALEDQLVRADLVVTTGGLSEGPRDTVRDVLAPLGSIRFDRVGMSPGRLQGLGFVGEGDEAVPIFALPGRPAAAQISFEVFVRPALRAIAGYSEIYRPSVVAAVARGWESSSGEREFVPATVNGSPSEGYRASPLGEPGRQADWSAGALCQANALLVVPEDQTWVRSGATMHCLILEG